VNGGDELARLELGNRVAACYRLEAIDPLYPLGLWAAVRLS
jgi:hypothetical protein